MLSSQQDLMDAKKNILPLYFAQLNTKWSL